MGFSEVKALESILNVRAVNNYPTLYQQQSELDISITNSGT